MLFVPPPLIARQGPSLMDAILSAGLSSNLQLCLDAGDPISYPGSGTKWLDRSGNGYDFFLGTDGTTSAPTFVSAGRGSYWNMAGKFFRYDSTNETWMQNLHKDNAIWSFVLIYYRAASASTHFGTDAGTTTGIHVAGTNNFTVTNATATVITKAGDLTPTANTWYFLGDSLTEATGAGGGFLYANGAYNKVSGSDTFDSTYSSPASGNATATMEIGAEGNGANTSPANARLSCIAIWGGTAITKANMDTLYAALRGRVGI